MSFDLFVFVPPIPTDLIPQWEQRLLGFGLRCTFYPGYHPTTWHDVFAPVRVEVIPRVFPYAGSYPACPLLTEIEVWDAVETLDEFTEMKARALEEAPIALHARLDRAMWCLHFRTAASRTLIEFRLQCFVAATLAVMTDGVLLDPQQGGYLGGQKALKHAAQLADDHEQRAAPEDWQLASFTDWSAWDGELPE